MCEMNPFTWTKSQLKTTDISQRYVHLSIRCYSKEDAARTMAMFPSSILTCAGKTSCHSEYDEHDEHGEGDEVHLIQRNNCRHSQLTHYAVLRTEATQMSLKVISQPQSDSRATDHEPQRSHRS